LNTATWIAIYMPIFILFIIILPQQNRIQRLISLKIKRRKVKMTMTNEMIKKYIGKNCKISTGPYGTSVTGKVIDVNENWIEIETKKGNELMNADFVQNIKICKL
jgi:hypothetical protein